MIEMAQVERIRWMLHVEGKSQREVARALHMFRHTVAKYANETDVPCYRRTHPYGSPVMTPALHAEITRLLAENEILLNRKQRWIGHTIFLELQKQGYVGSEPTVRRYLARLRQDKRRRLAFIPLEYRPGEAGEFDWMEAEMVVAGQRVKAQCLCYRLRWSHMPFVRAYPNQRQEAMFDGLRWAFETAGGAPLRLTSDNLKQAVERTLEGRNRKEQDAYLRFRTHYLVDSNFCNPASGHEKGSVENLGGFAQRNIVGPHLEASSWAEVNKILWQRCLDYAERTFPGEPHSVREQWQQEQRVLRPLPHRPFDCSRILPVASTGMSLARFETCRYSVPTRYAYHDLMLHAYWDRIEVYHGVQRIATHPRSYTRHQDIRERQIVPTCETAAPPETIIPRTVQGRIVS